MKFRPVVLVIMDGWGVRSERQGNAIAQARTPNFQSLWKKYPHTTLEASGEAVGIVEGQQGNSEVGHLNIGAGRVVFQSITRINRAIKDRSFFKNQAFLDAIENCRKNKSALHIMGLVQDQGVHSHEDHLFALLDLCRQQKFDNVFIHFFADGRDTPPKSSLTFLAVLEKHLKPAKIGTIVGRYYAMDRDNNWQRTQKAYEMLCCAKGMHVESAKEAIENAYSRNETDEFILPTVIGDYSGIRDRDSIIFFNYRLDRARQLTKALTEKGFSEFERCCLPKTKFVAMTEYYSKIKAAVAFGPQPMTNLLAQVISHSGKRQLHASETEKYAHVTFFFNGQMEEPSKNEDRILVPSPKVATYDLKPEMSAYELTDKLVAAINSDKYDFIITNIVNCDMVGHTGNWPAIIKAIEVVDDCVGKISSAVLAKGGVCIITADHGNAELKQDKDGKTLTAHTTSDVPLVIAGLGAGKLRKGILSDIAPTVLELMGLKQPKEMTSSSLIT